ncbi:unnamed protein product [Prunus armeniaca]|uniref:G-patch domain-containing protein n=1 Tax=Prunus armeniaca TaxID=36596 RepID=A0A6J5UXU1_PRUAR|nr:hypothetical protein GBA52_017378 [Prunus armeniaca]CAB4280743.1 unnamed protein product [Prunus armeniaca]CAB4311147.1 unnamed protein product [Prunus armeniaca]
MEGPSPNPSSSATEPGSLDSHNSFVWDESSQLYFHAGSGFYHDPNAGWYYSTRDGLYYKFEDGNYVLLPSHQADNLEICETQVTASENPIQRDLFAHESECIETIPEEPIGISGTTECCSSSDVPENPPPTSEWLEDTLIDLYLSGYSNLEANAADDMTVFPETDVEFGSNGNNDSHELNGGKLIPDDHDAAIKSSENVNDEGASLDEENWRAQYGQVIQSEEVSIPESSLVSLWDWEMITKPRQEGKGEVARLVGRLVRRSAKLHPSMPSGGGLLKTAPICEVHLDLVRVITGQVYKLRRPSIRYLSSLSTYDSSNPTKDWGFPELSVNTPLSKSSVNSESITADGVAISKDLSLLPGQIYEKHESYTYRDRAADRRALHGGFGVGPGQKNSLIGDSDSPPGSTEEAAAEALNMSFGVGSYARKLLENMGWKEGEALGKSTKGLVEPIQAHSNIGNAGLGWPQGRFKHP